MPVVVRLAVVGDCVLVAAVVENLGQELVQRPGVAELVLRDRADRDVLLEQRRDARPLGIHEPRDELVVGHGQQQLGERDPGLHLDRSLQRGHDAILAMAARPVMALGARGGLGGARALACGRELVAHHVAAGLLERPVERRVEQVGVLEDRDVRASDDPEAGALVPTPEQLARVVHRQLRVRGEDVAAMPHRVAFLGLLEDLVRLDAAPVGSLFAVRWLRSCHQAVAGTPAAAGAIARSPKTVSRTQRVSSRLRRRKASRSCDFGPWPVTTDRSSSQSGSV